MTELTLTIRFEGGEADTGRLPIYSSAVAQNGLARAVNIVTHSFANDEEMRSKGHSAAGATVYASAPQKGCFELEVDVAFEDRIVNKMGSSVIGNRYWDYLTWCWSFAVGQDYAPRTSFVQRIVDDEVGKIEEIADALESSLVNLHKPIADSPDDTFLVLSRRRVGDVLTLDWETSEYVNVRAESQEDEYFVGNVTKFNILTNYGRMYVDELRRVVSFRVIEDPSHRLGSMITKSMHDRMNERHGKLNFLVRKIESARGTVKRFVVHEIYEVR